MATSLEEAGWQGGGLAGVGWGRHPPGWCWAPPLLFQLQAPQQTLRRAEPTRSGDRTLWQPRIGEGALGQPAGRGQAIFAGPAGGAWRMSYEE